MIHFREYHQDMLDKAKVARCTICWTWFNSIATAKTHLERNHYNILTNRKQIREHQDIIEQTADKSQIIDYRNKKYTTGLREVECFANITDPNDCFTCSIRPTQKRLQIEKTPPIQQIINLKCDKMTQVSMPVKIKCHESRMDFLDFTVVGGGGKEKKPRPTEYKSVFETKNDKPYKRRTFDYS